MPLYEYKCEGCSRTFEQALTISHRKDPEKEPCPYCGDGPVKSLIGGCHVSYGVRNGLNKMPEGFKERMRQIKKDHPGGFKNSEYF